MKAGLSLTDFAAEVQNRDNAKADYLAPVKLLDVQTNGHTSLVLREVEDTAGNELAPLEINPIAHGQLAQYLGVPKAFYDHVQRNTDTIRDPNDPTLALYDTLVNGLLRSCPDDTRLVRTLHGQARGFLSDRYRQMDNLEILARMLPVIQQLPAVNWDQSSLQITDQRMYLQLVDTSKPRVIKSGTHNRMDDVLQRGVVITNSEVGLGSFSVQPLVFRQVCSNGLVITEYAQRKFHVGGRNGSSDPGIVWQTDTQKARNEVTILEMRDLMVTSMSDEFLDKIAARAQDAADQHIKGAQVEPVIKNVTERFRLTNDERGAMSGHFYEGGDLSLWGLVNSITRAAQDVESYDRSVELQAIGGNLLALPKHEVNALLTEINPN
jgi:hypothetical protein